MTSSLSKMKVLAGFDFVLFSLISDDSLSVQRKNNYGSAPGYGSKEEYRLYSEPSPT